jgi:putative transposase
MPWKKTCAMDERVRFVADWLSGDFGKRELCEAYGISRPTGDKWIARYRQEGADGLKERSRAPRSHPNVVPEALRARIIEMKLAHQSFGPKKVTDRLRERHPQVAWPADSTAGEILKRAGLVKPRVRRRRAAPDPAPFGECVQPNYTWSADFKGDFRLGNGRRCYPLTISDNFSRYLLACRGLERTTYQAVRPWFEWTFREHGLPRAIRTDNGSPFASLALGGLTQLSKWWIDLGIRPERIRPGKPAQNGRHERMHRTLKAAGVAPIQATLEAQQRQLDAFVREYNWERSHEALGRKTPAACHGPSVRGYPTRIPPVEYDSGMVVRRVRHNGEIKWQGDLLYVCEVLAGARVGLKQVDDERWELRYRFHLLGTLDARAGKIVPAKRWHGAK